MKKIDPLLERTDAGLDRCVGYAEILQAYPVSKSTIERAWGGPWRAGEPQLPEPAKVRGRALWPASVVNAWGRQYFAHMLDQSAAHLDSLAKTDPADLAPEQLEDQARDLAAHALSKRTGKSVDPKDLSLQLTQRITEDEFNAAQLQEFEIWSERFADIEIERAMYLAAWIFPPLRDGFANALRGSSGADQFRDADLLRVYGAAALYDDTWEELNAPTPVNEAR